MSFKKLSVFTALSLSFAATAFTPNAQASADPALVESLSKTLLGCVVQPFGINERTGNKVFGALRSHCRDVKISRDRVIIRIEGRSYTVLVKDSQTADDGDLNDLYVQYDSREDQEVELGSNLLSFGDPALSILMLTGHRSEELPQVEDSSLDQNG